MRPAKAEDSAALERYRLRDRFRVRGAVGRLRLEGERERVPTLERALGLASEVGGHGFLPRLPEHPVSSPDRPCNVQPVGELLRDEEADVEVARLARAEPCLHALVKGACEGLSARNLGAEVRRIDVGALVAGREEDDVRGRKDVEGG